jgi:hypothetical protein
MLSLFPIAEPNPLVRHAWAHSTIVEERKTAKGILELHSNGIVYSLHYTNENTLVLVGTALTLEKPARTTTKSSQPSIERYI